MISTSYVGSNLSFSSNFLGSLVQVSWSASAGAMSVCADGMVLKVSHHLSFSPLSNTFSELASEYVIFISGPLRDLYYGYMFLGLLCRHTW
jgi:hypothetical protein